jgi:hypothetical protein
MGASLCENDTPRAQGDLDEVAATIRPGEDLTGVKEARWVIIRKHAICDKDLMVRNYFLESLSPEDYETITLDYPDTAFEYREVLCWHNFRTVTDEDRVVIYRKIRSGDK